MNVTFEAVAPELVIEENCNNCCRVIVVGVSAHVAYNTTQNKKVDTSI